MLECLYITMLEQENLGKYILFPQIFLENGKPCLVHNNMLMRLRDYFCSSKMLAILGFNYRSPHAWNVEKNWKACHALL